MTDSNETKLKYLDYLLKDFEAIKSEISRRSNLQRVVLATFLAIIAFTFEKAASGSLSSLWIVGLWCSSALALQFYLREDLEIKRIGVIIKERIASDASKALGKQTSSIFHSETNSAVERFDRFTRKYDRQFNWVVFWAVPFLFSLLFIVNHWRALSQIFAISTLAPWKATIALVAAARVAVLLYSHVWPSSHQT